MLLGRRSELARRQVEEHLFSPRPFKSEEEPVPPRIRVALKEGIYFRQRPQVTIDAQHDVDAQ